MLELIVENAGRLEDLCRRHRVKTLEVFGSATDGTFDPAASDLDFLVRFDAMTPVDHGRAYFGLLFGLEGLFARNVDLVEPAAIVNPYFLSSVNESRQVIYAA